ncbi:MAG: phenylacetate--CoA ligase family protein, partial [Rhodospirillales bacterium]
MTAHDFYDELEVRDPAQREEMLFNGLVTQLKEAQKHAPYFKTLIGSIDASLIKDREALATIPITRKADLVNLQAKGNLLGGLTT